MASLPYLLLIPVFIVCILGSLLSYTDSYRQSNWFLPLFLLFGLLVNLVFGYSTKVLDSKEKIYVYALYFDAVIMTAYYVLPLILFSTRPKPIVIAGAFCVIAGLIIVKIFG